MRSVVHDGFPFYQHLPVIHLLNRVLDRSSPTDQLVQFLTIRSVLPAPQQTRAWWTAEAATELWKVLIEVRTLQSQKGEMTLALLVQLITLIWTPTPTALFEAYIFISSGSGAFFFNVHILEAAVRLHVWVWVENFHRCMVKAQIMKIALCPVMTG